jgi:hypothetical protein
LVNLPSGGPADQQERSLIFASARAASFWVWSGFSEFRLSESARPAPINGHAQRRQADQHSTPKPVALDCGIQLRGSIDLVERHANGHIRISDHKTGKADGEDGQIIDGGKSLQPALYALVAEKLFRSK